MNDSLNICLSCGLCCDGTLIGFVQLERKELPRLREFMNVEEGNGNGVLIHPCNKYCDGCTVYSKRPKQCASFKCGLLKSVEQKELEFDSAVEMIKELEQKKDVIEKQLVTLKIDLKSPSFYFKTLELKTLLQKKKENSFLSKNEQKLSLNLKQFDSMLLNNFGVS